MSTPMNMEEIDRCAFALMYIQWLAYGGPSSPYPLLGEWPDRVRQLKEHCTCYRTELPDLSAALNQICQHKPYEWRQSGDPDISGLKNLTKVMWKAAFKRGGGFIAPQLKVQIEWYYTLNYFAVENSLTCLFAVHGSMTETPQLCIKVQGRVKSLHYGTCSAKQRARDRALLDKCAGNMDV